MADLDYPVPTGTPPHSAAASEALEQQLCQLVRLRKNWELSAGFNHDLRNMLHAISAAVHVIGEGHDLKTALDPQTAAIFDDIRATCTGALQIFDLLNVVTKGRRLEVHDLEVPPVVDQAVRAVNLWLGHNPKYRALNFVIDADGIDADLEAIPTVRADRLRLFNILLNLLFNAAEAMPQGGRIQIHARPLDDELEIDVIDEGTGMDEGTRQRVFEPFFSSKGEAGAGLGLAMVRHTVEEWGGRVSVASAPGAGSTFTLYLPVAGSRRSATA